MPRVKLPDGKIAQFPDTMSPAEISAELEKAYPVWQEDPSRGHGWRGALRGALSDPWSTLGDLVDISTTSAMAPFEPVTAMADYGAATVRGEKTGSLANLGTGVDVPSSGGWGRLARDLALANQGPLVNEILTKHPTLNGIARRGLERVGELTNPGNLMPLGEAVTGNKFFTGIVAAGAGKSAIQDIRAASTIYQREGASHDFWQALTDAGVDSALFVFVARGLRSGKPVEQAVKEAKSEMGKGSSTLDTAPMPEMRAPEELAGQYGKVSAEAPAPPEPNFAQGAGSFADTLSDTPDTSSFYGKMPAQVETPVPEVAPGPFQEARTPSPTDAPLEVRQRELLGSAVESFPLTAGKVEKRVAGSERGVDGRTYGEASPEFLSVMKEAHALPAFDEVMDFSKSIYEAVLPKMGQFLPPDVVRNMPFIGSMYLKDSLGATYHGSKGGGGVTINPLRIVQAIVDQHGTEPIVVQARLLKKELAVTIAHELSHAVDMAKSTHDPIELERAGTGEVYGHGPERFELVEAAVQHMAKPDIMRIAESIPDEKAMNWLAALSEKSRQAYGLAPNEPVPQGFGRDVKDLGAALADRPGEEGAVTLGLLTDPIISAYNTAKQTPHKVRAAGDFIGDWMRTSVAGDLGTSVRNVYSGTRMIGQNIITNGLAASLAESRAQWYSLRGMTADAAASHQAAAIFAETAKAYPVVGVRELPHTLLDMWDAVTKEEGVGAAHGAFKSQIEAMKAFGLKKEAMALDKMSAAELLSRGESLPSWKRLMMFFNIAGDRAITRTVLSAHLEAIQHVFGVKDAKGLAKLAQNETLRPVVRNYLEYASSEAMRAAWNLPYAHGGKFQAVVRDVAALPVVGVLTVPFGRALAANFLPGVLESMPLFNHLSKRVRNSYTFNSLSILQKELGDQLRQLPSGVPQHVEIQAAMTKNASKMRELRETGVYSIDQIRARTMIGPLVVAGAAALRYMRGDDGTEFDQLNGGALPGGAVRAMNFNGMMGEVLPFVFYGDYLGHYKLYKDGKVPQFKYAGGKRTFQPEKFLGKAFFGSRYGYTNPSVEILKAAMEVAQGKKDFDKDYFIDLATKVVGDAERMAGSGAWIGSLWRGLTAEGSPEQGVQRRTDLEPLGGLKSQLPPFREELPPAQNWLEGGPRRQQDPLLSSTSLLGTAQRVGPLEQWINQHQGQINMGDVLPRRSRDPKFDELYNKNFSEAMQEQVIPYIKDPSFSALPEEEQIAKFVSAMQKARKWAHTQALYDYQDATGTSPDELIQKGEKKEEKKERDRLRRGGPRFPHRKEPRP